MSSGGASGSWDDEVKTEGAALYSDCLTIEQMQEYLLRAIMILSIIVRIERLVSAEDQLQAKEMRAIFIVEYRHITDERRLRQVITVWRRPYLEILCKAGVDEESTTFALSEEEVSMLTAEEKCAFGIE